jgi:hypothetical protein
MNPLAAAVGGCLSNATLRTGPARAFVRVSMTPGELPERGCHALTREADQRNPRVWLGAPLKTGRGGRHLCLNPGLGSWRGSQPSRVEHLALPRNFIGRRRHQGGRVMDAEDTSGARD